MSETQVTWLKMGTYSLMKIKKRLISASGSQAQVPSDVFGSLSFPTLS